MGPRREGGARYVVARRGLDGGEGLSEFVTVRAITHTVALENFRATMEQVCADRAPVIITRDAEPPVVMLSLEDYESMEETAYLTRSPANARRLRDSIRELENGQGVTREIDLDA